MNDIMMIQDPLWSVNVGVLFSEQVIASTGNMKSIRGRKSVFNKPRSYKQTPVNTSIKNIQHEYQDEHNTAELFFLNHEDAEVTNGTAGAQTTSSKRLL